MIVPTITNEGGFTRASVASYFDSAGVLQSAGINVLRIGYNPLNLTLPPAAIAENAATNILLNSATLSTQSVTVTANSYTLSFYGTGTITLSGAATGTVVGTGASPNRRSFILNPTAGTLTLTVTGSCTNAQLELGSMATSWIATTGTAATRAADVLVNGLVFSNIPEADHPVYNAATTYAIGDRVIYLHRKYESLRATNLNHTPGVDASQPPYWLDIGPTNRYAMFDGKVGTQTTSASSNITVVIKNGLLNGLSFMEMDAAKVQVALSTATGVVYTNTIDLSTNNIDDWYEYFTTDIVRATDSVVTDVPAYLTGVLTVVVSSPTGTVKCGNLVAGTLFDLGSTESSPTVSIIDYSVKQTDAFGNPTLVERAFSKRMNAKMLLPSSRVDSLVKKLASVRAKPCVFIGAKNVFESLIVYGYYKDFEVDIAYANTSYCTLQVEGLT